MRFSVIAPVYGVEKYLKTFVESVLSQTYTDFELILVDDVSPDECPAICDSFAEKDTRVRVIHKAVNEGPGFARNTGLAVAKGDYVLFVDSDDYICSTLLEECNDALDASVDILAYGVNFCYEDAAGKTVRTETLTPQSFFADSKEGKAAVFSILSKSRIFQYNWNKLYKRDFLERCGAQFDQIRLGEDFLFNIYAFAHADCVRSINKAYYNYRKPQHETLASKYRSDFFDISKRKYTLEKEFLENCGCFKDEYAQIVMEGYVKHIVSAVLRNRSKKSGLSKQAQRTLTLEMCTDPITVEVMEQYKPTAMVYRVLCLCIKKQDINTFLSFCLCIEFAQQRLIPFLKKLLKK